MVTPVFKRDAVAHLQVFHGMSKRRACKVLGADRTTIGYYSQPADDQDLREKLRKLAQQRRRFGYRRLPGFAGAPISMIRGISINLGNS